MLRSRTLNKFSKCVNRANNKSYSTPSNGGTSLKTPSTSSSSSKKDDGNRSKGGSSTSFVGLALNGVLLFTTISIYSTKLIQDEEFRKYNEDNAPLCYIAPAFIKIGNSLPKELQLTIPSFGTKKDPVQKPTIQSPIQPPVRESKIEEFKQEVTPKSTESEVQVASPHSVQSTEKELKKDDHHEVKEVETTKPIHPTHVPSLPEIQHHQHHDTVSHEKSTTSTHDNDTTTTNHSILPSVSSELILKKFHSEALATTLEDHKQQAIALRQEIENTILKDIQKVDQETLKIRLIQLAADLYERTKWEGIRLHQSLKQVEYELSNKYSELLKTQRIELEVETSKKLASLEQQQLQETSKKIQEYIAVSEDNLTKLLKEQKEKHDQILNHELSVQENKLKIEFETDINNQVAILKNEFIQSKIALQEEIYKVTSQLVAYENIINDLEKTKTKSFTTHQESAVLLALETALHTPLRNFKHELINVQKFYSNQNSDTIANNTNYKLVETLIGTLPASITKVDNYVTPPTLSELKYRFKVVRTEIRKVALAPPQLGNQFIGQSVGSVLAYISTPPEGLIKGDGTEEVLSRTNYFLEKGLLNAAVQEMEKLNGTYSATLATDWIRLAEQRLIIDQTVKTLKANNILNHLSIANSYK